MTSRSKKLPDGDSETVKKAFAEECANPVRDRAARREGQRTQMDISD